MCKEKLLSPKIFELKVVHDILDEYFSRWKGEIPNRLLINGMPAIQREIIYMRDQFSRYIEILKVIPKSPRRLMVLDVGIGYGHLSILVKKLFDYEVFGIDIRRPEVYHWKKRFDGEGIKFELCNLIKDPIPFQDEYFDIVLFCEVLEHLSVRSLQIALKKINRVLKKDGVLILTTPNLAGLGSRLRLLRGSSPIPIDDFKFGHIRTYTATECISILQKSGFSIQNIHFKNVYTTSSLLHKLLFFLYKLIPALRNCIITKAKKNPKN